MYCDDVWGSFGVVLRRKSLHKEGRRWEPKQMVAVSGFFNVSYVEDDDKAIRLSIHDDYYTITRRGQVRHPLFAVGIFPREKWFSSVY